MKQTILLMLVLLLAACNDTATISSPELGKEYSDDVGMAYDKSVVIEPPRTFEPPAPPAFDLEKGSKIIKSGSISFEVSDLEESKAEVDTLIRRYDSYYENEQYNSYGSRISYFLTIRIPNADFDEVVAEMENGVGTLTSKNINTNDVTEEYVDLKIRLDNNLAYLDQYKEILGKAKSVQEIIDVKERIRKIEEEIESRKGRIQLLDDRVKYSTLTLELSQLLSRSVSNRPDFSRRVSNAFKGGISLFLSAFVALVNLWPFLLIIVFLIFFRKRIVHLFRRK